MAVFPSAEWLARYREVINGSEEYRAAAATWEGDVAFVLEAEPDRGVPDDLVAWLDLWHGDCRGARMITDAEGEKAAYAITAPYSLWREVLAGALDPVKGMMQGKLKLRGDLPTIVRHVRAANELVRLATLVPTEFLGDG
ncbi:MAG TPA: SCP2 sterol-binding domain-containing protein [Actinomycetes bacterium]|jgi:putative sterol carrier protein|nr:SCP2 sterol-binding domain-containing protein [Actinomycetes bacterium]